MRRSSVPSLRVMMAGGPGGKLEGDAAVNAVFEEDDNKTALDRALDSDFTEFAAVLRDELGGKRAADL